MRVRVKVEAEVRVGVGLVPAARAVVYPAAECRGRAAEGSGEGGEQHRAAPSHATQRRERQQEARCTEERVAAEGAPRHRVALAAEPPLQGCPDEVTDGSTRDGADHAHREAGPLLFEDGGEGRRVHVGAGLVLVILQAQLDCRHRRGDEAHLMRLG